MQLGGLDLLESITAIEAFQNPMDIRQYRAFVRYDLQDSLKNSLLEFKQGEITLEDCFVS